MTAKSQSLDTDIAVVGAGPAGMTAALLLAKAGYSTVLLAPPVNLEDGRTTALLAASVDLYERIGLWEKLYGATAPLRRMRMIDATGRLIRAPEVTFDSAELDLDAFGYNILNKDLNRILDDAASKEDRLKRLEGTVESYSFEEDHVTITTQDGTSLTARLCVAADGRRSPAREAAGIAVKSWSYPQTAVVMNLDHTQPHHETSNEFHTPTGPFTLVPLPGRKSSLVCVVSPEEAETLVKLRKEELEKDLENRARSILGKFTLATTPQSYPLSGLTAENVSANRLALVGEAAHVFPPIGAQGLNLGLRDVADLLKILTPAGDVLADPGAASLMKAYEKARRQDIASRTAAVDLLNRSLLTGFLPIQAMRSAGLYLADRIGPLRRFMMREGIAPQERPARSPFPSLGKSLRDRVTRRS